MGKTISDDIKIKIACDLEGGKLTRDEIAKKYDVSPSYVSRIAKEFNIGKVRNRKYKCIPDDVKESIIHLYESNTCNSNKEIALKFGLSDSAVSKILKEYKETIDLSPKDIEEEQEEVFTKLKVSNIFKCGLINNRHDMPVSSFIFDNVDNNLMFDYKEQESVCKEYIYTNVILNNKNGIVVYVTGLTCALASLIKVCTENDIGLTLMHYNTDTNLYQSQHIVGDVSFRSENVLTKLCSNKKSAYLYKCKEEDINKQGDIFQLILKVYDDSNNELYSVCYVTDTEFKGLELHTLLVSKMYGNKDKIGLFLNRIEVLEDTMHYERKNMMCRTYLDN